MAKTFKISEKGDGYLYEITGSNKNDGEYVSKNTEENLMLERIALVILGYKVKVVRL